MILSTKKRNDIAEKCKRRLNALKKQGYTVTNFPEAGKMDILKECYSEGSKPGILVELAKCKGLGRSKFADIVKEMNKERKKFSKDYRDSYYSKVAEFVSNHASDDEIKNDIGKLNKLFEEIKDIQNKAYEYACEQRKEWRRLINAECYNAAKKYGYYNKTVREEFKRTNILWFQQGLANKVLFAYVSNKSVITLEDGFTTWSHSFKEAKGLIKRFGKARDEILAVFENNPKLEPYLLTSSNSKEANKEIKSILKRIADYKDFVELQSQEWGHYANEKRKNQPEEKWDKVKLEVAEYMSKLNWEGNLADEEKFKKALENLRNKQDKYETGGVTTLKNYLKEHKYTEIGKKLPFLGQDIPTSAK